MQQLIDIAYILCYLFASFFIVSKRSLSVYQWRIIAKNLDRYRIVSQKTQLRNVSVFFFQKLTILLLIFFLDVRLLNIDIIFAHGKTPKFSQS